MIWVTEGSLKYKDQVRATNSDPILIKIFVDFLLRVCRVKPERIYVRVVYYPNMAWSVDEVRVFWAQETGLSNDQIKIEHYHRVHNYHAPSKYGTATVNVGSIKLKEQLKIWLYEIYENLE